MKKLLIFIGLVFITVFVVIAAYFFYLKSQVPENTKNLQTMKDLPMTGNDYNEVNIGDTRTEIEEEIGQTGSFVRKKFTFYVYEYPMYNDDNSTSNYKMRMFYTNNDELAKVEIYRK